MIATARKIRQRAKHAHRQYLGPDRRRGAEAARQLVREPRIIQTTYGRLKAVSSAAAGPAVATPIETGDDGSLRLGDAPIAGLGASGRAGLATERGAACQPLRNFVSLAQ
jgi:hypothetical protein